MNEQVPSNTLSGEDAVALLRKSAGYMLSTENAERLIAAIERIEGSLSVAPIAKLTVRDGLVQRAGLYAPGLPDGDHAVFPVPLNPNGHLVPSMFAGPLCPHGMPLAENICGPCSEGRPNRASPEPPADPLKRIAEASRDEDEINQLFDLWWNSRQGQPNHFQAYCAGYGAGVVRGAYGMARPSQPPAPEPGVCRHGTRAPHECRECIDEDVIRTRAFWSLDRKELISAYVSDKDITLMDDNGRILEPAGDEQRHGPSPTKEARPFTPMDREQLREKIAAGPDPEPEIGAGTLSIDWNEVGPVDAKECSGSGEEVK